MLLLFTATIFLSAALLFLVQPMAGKMLLPLAGGSPAVWNTCMVFFQAALLGGYLYSHLITTRLRLRTQVIVHGAVSIVAAALLPLALPTWQPPVGTLPLIGWLVGILAIAVGGPFFIVSTTGPLLQKWFSATDHAAAKDPYFLYAASNIGSAVGLLGYPLLIEPSFNLRVQGWAWAAGYAGLLLLLIGCGLVALKRPAPATQVSAKPDAPKAPAPTWRRRLTWTALAAVPSSLMIAVTQHISTDISPMPLLWVIPLFLYLLTFTLAFSPRIPLHTGVLGWLVVAISLVQAFLVGTGNSGPFVTVISIHIGAFVLAALMCHRRLADDRPDPSRLTEFFLFIALGGVLGGLFNAIVAPLCFNLISEFPIAIAAACLLRPTAGSDNPAYIPAPVRRLREAMRLRTPAGMIAAALFWPLLGAAVCMALDIFVVSSPFADLDASEVRAGTSAGLAALLVIVLPRHPAFALFLSGAMFVGQAFAREIPDGQILFRQRSFFGVSEVRAHVPKVDPGAEYPGAKFEYMHGTTTHGVQIRNTEGHTEKGEWIDGTLYNRNADDVPRSYYHRLGPVGELFAGLDISPDPMRPRASHLLASRPIASIIEFTQLAVSIDPSMIVAVPGAAAAATVFWKDATARVDAAYAANRVGVLGLGTGSIAAYAVAGQTFDFYEIDPVVRDINEDPQGRYFTFVRNARDRGARINIKMGDGRLEIAKAPDGYYRVIVLDAFSSDAIPIHLLTQEALKLYLTKLAPDGVLFFHISNRYFNLAPVLARAGKDLELTALGRADDGTSNRKVHRGVTTRLSTQEAMAQSMWVAMAPRAGTLAELAADKDYWIPLQLRADAPRWTDDFSNILDVFTFGRRATEH